MRKGYNESSINQINKEVILNHVVKNTTLRKKCILTDCIILFYCRLFINVVYWTVAQIILEKKGATAFSFPKEEGQKKR